MESLSIPSCETTWKRRSTGHRQPGAHPTFADGGSGDVTPSGKLTDTFAASFENYPSSANSNDSGDYVCYTDDIFVNYRYVETISGAAKLFVERSCFAAPLGELFSGPAGTVPAAPAGAAPDRASSCAAQQESRIGSPTPADAADCPETASYRTGRFLAYPA